MSGVSVARCHPSAYHVWIAMLNRLLAETPGLASDVRVQRAAAAGGAAAGDAAADGVAAAAAARGSKRPARRVQR